MAGHAEPWRHGSRRPRGHRHLLGGGTTGGILLAVFFISGTAAGRLFPTKATGLEFRATRREANQVLANGGAAAVGGLIGLAHPQLGLWVITAGLAAATADTWATEVGIALGGTPRDVFSRRAVRPGTSGGVTTRGTLAGVAGAVTLGSIAGFLAGSPSLGLASSVVGSAGMLADSIVGSRWQFKARCRHCGADVEEPSHCGTDTASNKGVAWISNDTVNALATGLAGLGGAVAWWLVRS